METMEPKRFKDIVEEFKDTPRVYKVLQKALQSQLRVCTVCKKEYLLKGIASRRRTCYGPSCESANKALRKEYYKSYYKARIKGDILKVDSRRARARLYKSKMPL